jgi:hypothetical protein
MVVKAGFLKKKYIIAFGTTYQYFVKRDIFWRQALQTTLMKNAIQPNTSFSFTQASNNIINEKCLIRDNEIRSG